MKIDFLYSKYYLFLTLLLLFPIPAILLKFDFPESAQFCLTAGVFSPIKKK